MPKRFTDTDKWKKPFIRGLKGAYKLLWFYIIDDCDHAGIWQVDFQVACLRIGEDVNEDEAKKIFGDRIEIFNNDSKWFIKDFLTFQYGELSERNRLHLSVINILKKNQIGPYKALLTGQGQGQGTIQGQGQGKEQEPSVKIEILDPAKTPAVLIVEDELCMEALCRLAAGHRIADLTNLLTRWEGWYMSKFEWRKKTFQEYRKSFESWIIDPKSRIENGKQNSITPDGTLNRLNSYRD